MFNYSFFTSYIHVWSDRILNNYFTFIDRFIILLHTYNVYVPPVYDEINGLLLT